MLLKLFVLGITVAIAAAQFNPLMMMSMGGFGSQSSVMNDPVYLCMNTENIRMVPCRDMKDMCDMVAMQQNPAHFGMLTCSPLGVGCCAKDAMSLMMLKRPPS